MKILEIKITRMTWKIESKKKKKTKKKTTKKKKQLMSLNYFRKKQRNSKEGVRGEMRDNKTYKTYRKQVTKL